MRFISIIITFLIIFNFNSFAYSNDFKSFKSELISNINIDNSFLLSLDNDNSLNIIDKKNDKNLFNNPFIVGHIPLLISYILSSFIFSASAKQISQSKDINEFYAFPFSHPFNLLFTANEKSKEAKLLIQSYSLLQLLIFSILSGIFSIYFGDENYDPNVFMTILGAFVGTILYFTSFNLSVILESQITYNNRSSLASFSFLILIVVMPIFTSTFATIFYNISKKPKEKILTEAEIIEEQRKIQESLLYSLNNIQVNRGNIEYKVFAF